MKFIPRVLSLSLPLIAAITTISSGAAFAQTTSIPISGTVSGTVSSINGSVSLSSYSLLSPVGTVSGNGGTVISPTSGTIVTGGSYTVVGTTNGGVVFNDGRTASFINAPTNLNTTVNSISPGSSLVIGTIPSQTTFVGLTINSGSSISIPTSSIVAAPTTPITTPTVVVQSLGIASALVILDPAFSPKPSVGPQIVTAFSSDPNAIFASSLTSRVSPYLQN